VKATPPSSEAGTKARVLVADDHDVVRKGLRAILENAGHEVCAEASTGREAVDLTMEHRPDVVVVDLSMPDMGGLEATLEIKKARPATEVLVLTMHKSEETIRDLLSAGARGYMLKSDVAAELQKAVASLLAHKSYLSSSVGDVVMSGFVSGAAAQAAPRRMLTARELEIVRHISEGRSTKEIAAGLRISVKTVETHRTNALRRLGLHTVSDVVRYAIRNGLIEA